MSYHFFNSLMLVLVWCQQVVLSWRSEIRSLDGPLLNKHFIDLSSSQRDQFLGCSTEWVIIQIQICQSFVFDVKYLGFRRRISILIWDLFIYFFFHWVKPGFYKTPKSLTTGDKKVSQEQISWLFIRTLTTPWVL